MGCSQEDYQGTELLIMRQKETASQPSAWRVGDAPCTMKMTSEYRGELKRLTRVWGPSWAARALGVSLPP